MLTTLFRRNGLALPTYRAVDPATGREAVVFVDPLQVPQRNTFVVVSDGERCWRCRYEPDEPLSLGFRLLGVSRAVVVFE